MNRQPVAAAPSHFYAYPPHQHGYHDPALASLAYRPLHLPLEHAPAAEHQQFSPLAATPGFHHPNFRHQLHLPHRTRQQTRHARAMAYQQQQQGMTEGELAELQKLSNEYEPEATVSFVNNQLGVC